MKRWSPHPPSAGRPIMRTTHSSIKSSQLLVPGPLPGACGPCNGRRWHGHIQRLRSTTSANSAEVRSLEASNTQAASSTPVRTRRRKRRSDDGHASLSTAASLTSGDYHRPILTVTRPLPKVLILHTGGTLGMDPETSYEYSEAAGLRLKPGTGGKYKGLKPGDMLNNLLNVVPELSAFANLDLAVVFNKDSSRVGPPEWVKIARLLDKHRAHYDAFLLVHGTDTMAHTASALSLMLQGFRKPIVMTGSQLPLASPRSDARQNLLDSLTCATAAWTSAHVGLQEVAVCFDGKLMRGNRAQKVNSSSYQAFDSPSYPKLATLGIDVEWNDNYLLRPEGGYRPRFKLDPRVIRIPIVPGSDPRHCYGDLFTRGVRGVVLEAFGVGNMPDEPKSGWLPWLRDQTRKGLQVYLASQCTTGPLHPELYRSGSVALRMGVEAGPQMTPECAVVKMMLCLCYQDLPLGMPLAGEL